MADNPSSEPTRLYLFTPPIGADGTFLPILEEALAAADVACVLLHLDVSDDGTAKKAIRDVAAVVQRRGAALLVSGWSAVIARAGADGIHVPGIPARLAEAIASFKPERIVGAGAIRSRHDAMQVAESGADYVMFGEPAQDGRTPPLEAVVERTGWWAALFEVPCVAYAPDLGAVPVLADAGADFVAVGHAVWNHDQGPAAAMRLLDGLLKQRGTAP